jgi:spore coat protein CotH
MVALSQEIEASLDADLPATIERWMDVDHVMRLIAVDRAIRADDGPFHWWCNTGGNKVWSQQRTVGIYNCGNHNYFWYEETVSPRVWLLPWDMDASFKRNDAASALIWEWDDTSIDCSTVADGNIGRQWPPSCDRLTRGWSTYQAQYVASAAALLDGAFSAEVVDAKLDRWVAQLQPIVEQGLVLDRTNLSLDGWLAEVDTLRGYITAQRADLAARVAR